MDSKNVKEELRKRFLDVILEFEDIDATDKNLIISRLFGIEGNSVLGFGDTQTESHKKPKRQTLEPVFKSSNGISVNHCDTSEPDSPVEVYSDRCNNVSHGSSQSDSVSGTRHPLYPPGLKGDPKFERAKRLGALSYLENHPEVYREFREKMLEYIGDSNSGTIPTTLIFSTLNVSATLQAFFNRLFTFEFPEHDSRINSRPSYYDIEHFSPNVHDRLLKALAKTR